MCGINGLFGLEQLDDARSIVERMNTGIAHRGPDANEIKLFDKTCLGHLRLSIIDLNSAADQPMTDASGRFTIVFNGEVYNFEDIKKSLADYPFRTQSDTEVILAAYATWGPAALQLFNGMFAMAIWDEQEKELFIARDRVGIKPLYYSQQNQTLIFSSEIKGLLASGLISPRLNKEVLPEYLAYQTVHDPNTLLQDVFMLPAAHYMILKDAEQEIIRYWSPGQSRSALPMTDRASVCKDIRSLLSESVERRMISDVPFGAFLSGGIDSSAMVGLMAELSNTQVSTFSVSFDESEFSEASYARLIADTFKTAHHDIVLSPNQFLEELPRALAKMDHPSGDGPNTYVVSKATKEAGITVAISGLGGDELFAGYDLFKHSRAIMDRPWLSQYPMFMRKMVAWCYRKYKPGIASRKASSLLTALRMELPYIYPVMRQTLLDDEIKALLAESSFDTGMKARIQESKDHWAGLAKLSQVSIAEMDTYMRSVLLRDTDQMSMLHALEVRVPFLDHTLIEYMISVPDEFKYPHSPKALLVDSLDGLLPREIIDRPKMGFTLPWKEWMLKELRPFCVERLSALKERNILAPKAIDSLWSRFEKGDAQVTWSRIWPLVVLENWIEIHDVQT